MPMLMTTIMLQVAVPATAADHPPRLQNPEKIVDYGDYPTESLQREEYGITSIRLQVAADGKVTACDVTETSGHRLLDARTCTLYRSRARFEPAQDAGGTAIAGTFLAVTSWGVNEHQPRSRIDVPMQVSRLPPDYRRPVKARLASDAAGRIVACDIMESSGSDAGDRAACTYIRRALVLPVPKSGSVDVPAVAVRYLTATLIASPPAAR